MISFDVLTDVSDRLCLALEITALHFCDGRRVDCFFAFLPSSPVDNSLQSCGFVDISLRHENQIELAVAVDAAVLTKELLSLLLSQQEKHQNGDNHRLRVTDGDKNFAKCPSIAFFTDILTNNVLALALLLLPANGDLWNRRKRWLKGVIAENALCGRDGNITRQLLVWETLLTSLALSCHHKTQEIWAHRLWVTKQLLGTIPAVVEPRLFYAHDQAVLCEAADKHPMNYNAWNYRRQSFVLFISTVNGVGEWADAVLQELNSVVQFFERHNGDASAATYLIFLLEHATRRSDFGAGSGDSQLAFRIWRALLEVTARELRRHFDKGHEVVWLLRLALVRWALHEHIFCGWKLQDELEFVSTYVAVAGCDGESDATADVNWLDISGSPRWTSYHASRYGLQLLSAVQTEKKT